MIKTISYRPIVIDFLLGREYDEGIISHYKSMIIDELMGFEIVVQNVDRFIKLVKKSKTKDDAKESVSRTFNLSLHQAEIILATKISDIAKLNLQIIRNAIKSL
ncbi:MAG: hypothetical protein FWE16_02935 [Firmicutes bacterium]|nr:hypothetical protein [Bacillota bacterium]